MCPCSKNKFSKSFGYVLENTPDNLVHLATRLTFNTVRSCSIEVNRFRLVGLAELFRVLLAKNRFWLVWFLNFFSPHQIELKRLKKHW